MGLNHCQSSTSIHQQISFKLTIFWIALLTLEADKIARLLACRHYKIDRDPQNSPLPELQKIKKAYLSMLLKWRSHSQVAR